MDRLIYEPSNVCSKMMEFYIREGKIVKIIIRKGCAGNTQGISKLSEGLDIDYVENKLCGIKCPGSKTKDTSCPDQISKALVYYKKIKSGEVLENINIKVENVPDDYLELNVNAKIKK